MAEHHPPRFLLQVSPSSPCLAHHRTFNTRGDSRPHATPTVQRKAAPRSRSSTSKRWSCAPASSRSSCRCASTSSARACYPRTTSTASSTSTRRSTLSTSTSRLSHRRIASSGTSLSLSTVRA
jgi:hypothetical protein